MPRQGVRHVSSHLGDDHAGHAHAHHDGSSRRTAIAALGPPRVEEVDRGVYAYVQPDGTWWINNCGFVTAPDGVIAIDTCATERRQPRLPHHPRRGVATTHPRARQHPPPRRPHPRQLADPPGDDRRSHPLPGPGDRVRTQPLPGGLRVGGLGELQLAPPMLTFDDHIDVWAGDTKMELHYIGTAAHTTNDIVAWLPSARSCSPETSSSTAAPRSS